MPFKILLIGGSGFVSGTLARRAVAEGHRVQAVSRGQRPVPAGVESITADRTDRAAFADAISRLDGKWDLVVDCIGYDPADAEQDVAVFRDRAAHFVFISTDFVYDPAQRQFPQNETDAVYLTDDSYGAKKRRCELIFANGDTGPMRWTVLRPCHIYGPGSLLGCLPEHGRDPQLLARLRRGETLRLVGGGHFLQQPIFADDLAQAILSCAGNETAHARICNVAGPDIVESRQYYRLIAERLGVGLAVEELPVADYLAANPGRASFLCHRIYTSDALASAGLAVPSTPLADGLHQQIDALQQTEKEN